MRSFGGRHRARLGLAAAAAAASLLLAACGSDNNSSSGTSSNSSSTGTSSSVVSDAQKVVSLANGKEVYSSKEEPSGPSDIQAYGDWRGPTSAPAHQAGKNVQIIVCTKQAVACVEAADGAVKAAQALGWKAEIIDGKGTPQGFSSAFDTAKARKADAVVTIAIPTVAVGNKISEMKKAGIITIGVGDKEPDSGVKYDGYVPFPMPTMNAVLAYADIAKNNGKSNTIVVEDPGFPVLTQSAAEYRKILGTCSGCKSTGQKWQITDASDPTKVQTIINSALTKNPSATGLDLPYAIGLPAAVQAVKSSGKNVDVYVKDADQVGLKAVADGSVLYNAGSSVTWAGWAGLDQVVRGLAKKPYLGPTQTGIAVTLFSKANVPKSGNIEDWPGLTDYQSQYKKIWGGQS